MSSRDIKDLIPEMQFLYALFHDEMEKQRQEYVVTCTYRSQDEQQALYNQGRTTEGQIVTWTLHSKHCERKAFDIAMIKNGKTTWNPADYLQAGVIGQKVGLEWGGSWKKSKDYPHFQYKEMV